MNVDFSARLAHYSNFPRFLGTTFLCLVKDTKMDRQYILHHIANEGRWESSINVWIPFMYFQKWNCYFQNRITVQCSVSEFLHSYISERFTYFQDQYAYSAAGKYVDRFWEYINRSQTHECGNWDWGRAIPRKDIHKWDFPCSAPYLTSFTDINCHSKIMIIWGSYSDT